LTANKPGRSVPFAPAPLQDLHRYYMNAALDQLRATGRPVLDADVVRLSPFVRRHLGVHGDYSFLLPELAGNLRELRDPHSDAVEED
jgi:Tn3 transposase DDE domain